MMDDLSATFSTYLDWLHRWFMTRGVDASTADDLVQLTLIEGWRNLHKLESADGMRPWLAAIAGFVLKRWWRAAVREAHAVLSQYPEVAGGIADDRLPAPSSGVEHEELATIVAQALERIPETDRRLLHARYDEERSVADLADGAGVTAAHMAVRLQRVRAKVRNALIEVGADGLAAYGFDPLAVGWKPTRLWCPMCGGARLTMCADSQAGVFAMKCPQCDSEPDSYFVYWQSPNSRPILATLRSASETLARLDRERVFMLPERDGSLPCPCCQRPLDTRVRIPPGKPDDLNHQQLELVCRACGPLAASSTYRGSAVLQPEGRAFWRRHERALILPPARERFDQQDAVRVDLVDPASSDRLTFIFAERGTRLLAVYPGR